MVFKIHNVREMESGCIDYRLPRLFHLNRAWQEQSKNSNSLQWKALWYSSYF